MTTVALLILGSAAFAQTNEIDRGFFDRGIEQKVFVPKGYWLTGATISYTDYGVDDFKFLVLDQIKMDAYSFNISPFIGYFIQDNLALGARFGYKRTKVQIDYTSIDLGDDFYFEIKDYYNLQHVYYGTAMMRNYMSLGDSKRFGIFNELRLTAGGGQGKFYSGKGDNVKGTYQDIYEFQLGVAPGMAAFVTNNVALEVSVGVLGFKYKRINQKTNQVYMSSYDKKSANFKIDLFSINVGIAFYLPSLQPCMGSIIKRGRNPYTRELKK